MAGSGDLGCFFIKRESLIAFGNQVATAGVVFPVSMRDFNARALEVGGYRRCSQWNVTPIRMSSSDNTNQETSVHKVVEKFERTYIAVRSIIW